MAQQETETVVQLKWTVEKKSQIGGQIVYNSAHTHTHARAQTHTQIFSLISS